MEMTVHLDKDIFEVVKDGTKCIEGRLYDEKRRKLNIGDSLLFINRADDKEVIETIVEDIKVYANFKEMVKHYSIEEMYLNNYTKDDYINLLKRFYNEEEQEKYGVVAIRFKKM